MMWARASESFALWHLLTDESADQFGTRDFHSAPFFTVCDRSIVDDCEGRPDDGVHYPDPACKGCWHVVVARRQRDRSIEGETRCLRELKSFESRVEQAEKSTAQARHDMMQAFGSLLEILESHISIVEQVVRGAETLRHDLCAAALALGQLRAETRRKR